MRILVSGANGFIGTHLVPFLEGRGHEVLTLPKGADQTPFDLSSLSGWPDWPEAVDAVVHLAALNPGRRDPAGRDVAAMTLVNVEGTRVFAERAAAEGVGRFVFLSSANVHQPRGVTPVTEADEPQPQSVYAASKLAAEAVLRQVAAPSSMGVCVLRPAPVYGRGGRGALSILTRLAAMPVPAVYAPWQRRSVLGIDNGLDAVATALTHPAAAGETFLVADETPLSIGGMVAAMRAGVGRSARCLPVPAPSARLLAHASARSSFLQQIFGSFVVDTGHIQSRLDWRAPLSSAEGLGKVLAP